MSCVGTAAAATSCASADAQCLCVQPSFINQVAECYAAECTPEESAIGVIFGEQVSRVGEERSRTSLISTEQYCASIGVTVSIPAVVASVTAGATDAAASAS